jgi:hypothetical protein
MLKASLIMAFLLGQNPPGQPAQRMEAACTGYCHGPSLIAQQRLDRDGWTREVEKMIRWGAQVTPTEKDALINYLTGLFNPSRPRPNTSRVLPEGKGKNVFQISCMSCHDEKPVTALKRDRNGWIREVDKMINWGAYVPTNRREELIGYLMTAFSN